MELILYSTDHCTLCDQALELLLSMPELAGQAVQVVDVATDDDLLDQYGERLPVLGFHSTAAHGAGVRVLDWPFDAAAVLGALKAISPD
jgi:hypothetical protein